MTKKGPVVPPRELLLGPDDVKGTIADAQQEREERKNAPVGEHVRYWNQASPGGQFEHWRFEQGWVVGFSDAQTFSALRTNGGLSGSPTGGRYGWKSRSVGEEKACGERAGWWVRVGMGTGFGGL